MFAGVGGGRGGSETGGIAGGEKADRDTDLAALGGRRGGSKALGAVGCLRTDACDEGRLGGPEFLKLDAGGAEGPDEEDESYGPGWTGS